MTARSAGLDLLRGVAVALVLLRHAAPAVFPGAGVVGVVMFFALSGYLITGVLLRLPSLGEFYRRRVRRLVPPLLAMLAGLTIVTLLLDPLGDRPELGWTLLWALTWTGNLPFGHASEATFHLWTLATEEQFYLVWPVALLALGPRRALVLAAGATVILCLATTWWAAEDPDLAYSLPTSWAPCFVVGAAVRLHGARATLPRLAAPVAALTLAVLSVVPLRGHLWTYAGGGPAIAALTGVLVLAWRDLDIVSGPVLPLVRLGVVSYAAYLWNYPLSLWLPAVPALALTLLAAALSWRLIEAPSRPRPRAVVT